MNYRSISQLNQTVLSRLSIIPRDIDLIVGIPRSGMLPANLLALYLNKPYTDIDSFINGHIYKAGARRQFFEFNDIKKVLIVDDSIASGAALEESKQKLAGMASKFDISYCCIYAAPGKEKLVDYYFETVPLPRYFQWNILNHTGLEKACFDIDGVLCVDPSSDQNDDGEKYCDFLLNAAPLFIPGSKIGTIVTSRLEKYRPQTEFWLQKHNIKYNNLVMLNMPDAKARQKAKNHGQHKAATYKSGQYSLFIESDLTQAHEINRLTGKPVLCTANFEMIYDHQSFLYNLKSGQTFPLLKKIGLRLRSYYRSFKQPISLSMPKLFKNI